MLGFLERLVFGSAIKQSALIRRPLVPGCLKDHYMKRDSLKTNEAVFERTRDNLSRHFRFNAPIKKIVGGIDHLLILLETGKIYAWGSNEYGQLGVDVQRQFSLWNSLSNDDTDDIYEGKPQLLETLEGGYNADYKAVDVAAGHFSSFVVCDSGRVYGWGAGILGTDNEYFDSRPQLLPINNAVSVQAWRDLVLVTLKDNRKLMFGAAIDHPEKVLTPTECTWTSLPHHTDEYPNIPIFYSSHDVVHKFTAPAPSNGVMNTLSSELENALANYDYFVMWHNPGPH